MPLTCASPLRRDPFWQPLYFEIALDEGTVASGLLVGFQEEGSVEEFGIHFVGVNAENGRKLLLTGALILIVWILRYLLRWLMRFTQRLRSDPSSEFWTRQAINTGTTLLLLFGVLSIWFDDPTRLATALGLVTAGLAFALQKVVTAIAGYAVILRGKTFTVGERITMGRVRGDVIGLGLIQTTIMEMGQPPNVQSADPAMWVHSRQYTGRIVTVTNDRIFDEAVYNRSITASQTTGLNSRSGFSSRFGGCEMSRM